MTSSTAALGEFASGLRYKDLPGEVVAHAKLCLLDTWGCALFGATLPWSRILRETVLEVDDTRAYPVWGTRQRLSGPSAALVNGSAVHAFELDDLHPQSIVHPGSVVLPAALAVRPLDGQALLTAVVAGYEVAARVGMSVGAAHLRAGWHPTGTHGTLGAAAAAGSALGLNPGQLANALGTAGSQSSGLMAAQYESMVKRLHAGRAAQSGVYAALLARNGYTGIADLFEAPYGGYGATLSPEFTPSALTRGLGQTWEILNVGFKPYSCNGSCHPTVDALLHLRAEYGLRAVDVASIDVTVSTATDLHVGWKYTPTSVTTAQMNLSYVASAVLLDGDAFVDQFRDDRLADPEILRLADLVHVHASEEIDAAGDRARHATIVEVTRTDGTVLRERRDHAKGSAHLPMTAQDVRAKYSKLAVKALTPTDAARLADLVDRIDELGDLAALDDLLSASSTDHSIPRIIRKGTA